MDVKVNQVNFAYGPGKFILKNISLSVEKTKTLSIVGGSGCGKSTLLRILCGILPDSQPHILTGQILIDGLDINADKFSWEHVRSTGKLGFMFQEPCLLPNLSIEDNIRLPLRILGNFENGQDLVADYLRITGLELDKAKLPDQLSGGMKTRTALARTFISCPTLLLLDEPFAALDIIWRTRLYDELRKLRTKTQSTVVLVTHDIFEAIYFSDQILVMGNSHSIVETVSIANWTDTISYDDVINNYQAPFVRIKQLLQSNSN
jgi:NitT/TauT family transport system ATP-binding protein